MRCTSRLSREELVTMMSFVLILLKVTSALMDLVENPAQPEKVF